MSKHEVYVQVCIYTDAEDEGDAIANATDFLSGVLPEQSIPTMDIIDVLEGDEDE